MRKMEKLFCKENIRIGRRFEGKNPAGREIKSDRQKRNHASTPMWEPRHQKIGRYKGKRK